jgi:hypothetical protein
MLKEVSPINLNYEGADQLQLNEPPKEAVRLAILTFGVSLVSHPVFELCIY